MKNVGNVSIFASDNNRSLTHFGGENETSMVEKVVKEAEQAICIYNIS